MTHGAGIEIFISERVLRELVDLLGPRDAGLAVVSIERLAFGERIDELVPDTRDPRLLRFHPLGTEPYVTIRLDERDDSAWWVEAAGPRYGGGA